MNEIEDIEKMKELGVDIISSDFPDRVGIIAAPASLHPFENGCIHVGRRIGFWFILWISSRSMA